MLSSFIADSELEIVIAHCSSVTQQEVGGLFVGKLTDGSVEVVGSIPSLKADSNSMNVTFTHEVWESALNDLSRTYPDCQIIGWYHSHPGFGIFLSAYDEFIQRNFFPDPRMIAVVIDPIAGQGGTFQTIDEEIKQVESFEVPKIPNEAVLEFQTKARSYNQRLTRLVATCAFGIVALGAGFLIGGGVKSKTVVTPPPVPSVEKKCYFPIVYGDTYWAIAQRFLGDGQRYPEIQSMNSNRRLYPGETLSVPCVATTK